VSSVRRWLSGFSLPALWVFIAVALPIVAALQATISTNDSAYQIRAGNIMLHTHHLIRTDPFTFTAAGRPWLDQQWASQVVFALFYRAGGWAALALLRAALAGAIFLFVYLACREAGASRRGGAWLALASFGVSVGGLSLRPQLIGMALFALAVWMVFARRRNPRILWGVPVVVAFWANMHGSFFLGPLLVGLAFLEDLYEHSPRARTTLTVTVVSAAAATLNPFGLRVWSYAWDLSTNPVITRFVTEWQPPTLRDLAGAVFFVSALAVVALLALRGRATPWPSLASLGVFFVIGLVAIRGIFWWAFIAPPVVALLLAQPSGPRRPEEKGSAGNPRLNLGIAALLVLLGISFLPWWRSDNPVVPSAALLTNAPTALTDELRTLLRPGERMFNPVPVASWFELELPQNPLFLDPRIEVFPSAVPRQFLKISGGRQGWQDILDGWHVRVVVADRGEEAGLLRSIRSDPGWKLQYQETSYFVFVRA
jgi:hypothetical protein